MQDYGRVGYRHRNGLRYDSRCMYKQNCRYVRFGYFMSIYKKSAVDMYDLDTYAFELSFSIIHLH